MPLLYLPSSNCMQRMELYAASYVSILFRLTVMPAFLAFFLAGAIATMSLTSRLRGDPMQCISKLFVTIMVLSANISHADTSTAAEDAQRPIWAIGHRVLTTQGVTDAVRHGANAIEIDMTAWKSGWWADHDGFPTSAGDTAEAMFDQIARERMAGATIGFVWLDIKNPNYCWSDEPEWRHCSVAALRDLARSKLLPHGVRVLYGFYGDADVGGSGWKDVAEHFIDDEAVALSGKYTEVRNQFDRMSILPVRRVMDYGYFDIKIQFGNCREHGYYTSTEVRQGAEATRAGVFAKTFS